MESSNEIIKKHRRDNGLQEHGSFPEAVAARNAARLAARVPRVGIISAASARATALATAPPTAPATASTMPAPEMMVIPAHMSTVISSMMSDPAPAPMTFNVVTYDTEAPPMDAATCLEMIADADVFVIPARRLALVLPQTPELQTAPPTAPSTAPAPELAMTPASEPVTAPPSGRFTP